MPLHYTLYACVQEHVNTDIVYVYTSYIITSAWTFKLAPLPCSLLICYIPNIHSSHPCHSLSQLRSSPLSYSSSTLHHEFYTFRALLYKYWILLAGTTTSTLSAESFHTFSLRCNSVTPSQVAPTALWIMRTGLLAYHCALNCAPGLPGIQRDTCLSSIGFHATVFMIKSHSHILPFLPGINRSRVLDLLSTGLFLLVFLQIMQLLGKCGSLQLRLQ